MDYTQILLKPVITEKASFLKDETRQVAFIVAGSANKVQIKRAVEEAFKVKVSDVRVVVRKSAPKTRQGRTVGRIAGWKKAYVTLEKGSKIELFEGV